jgi:hypothetical protein
MNGCMNDGHTDTEEDKCMSLLCDHRTLDLVAVNGEVRDEWAAALNTIISADPQDFNFDGRHIMIQSHDTRPTKVTPTTCVHHFLVD